MLDRVDHNLRHTQELLNLLDDGHGKVGVADMHLVDLGHYLSGQCVSEPSYHARQGSNAYPSRVLQCEGPSGLRCLGQVLLGGVEHLADLPDAPLLEREDHRLRQLACRVLDGRAWRPGHAYRLLLIQGAEGTGRVGRARLLLALDCARHICGEGGVNNKVMELFTCRRAGVRTQ